MKKILSLLLAALMLLSMAAYAEGTPGGVTIGNVVVALDEEEFELNPTLEIITDGTDMEAVIRNGDDTYLRFRLVFEDDRVILLCPDADKIGIVFDITALGKGISYQKKKEELKEKIDDSGISDEAFIALMKNAAETVADVEFPEEGDYELSFKLDGDQISRFCELLIGDELEELVDDELEELFGDDAELLDSANTHATVTVNKKDGIVSLTVSVSMTAEDALISLDFTSEDITVPGRSAVSMYFYDESGSFNLEFAPGDNGYTANFCLWPYSSGSVFDFIGIWTDIAVDTEAELEEIDLDEYTLVDPTSTNGDYSSAMAAAENVVSNSFSAGISRLFMEDSVAALFDYVLSTEMNSVTVTTQALNTPELDGGAVFTDIPEALGVKKCEADMTVYSRELEYANVRFLDDADERIASINIYPREREIRMTYLNGSMQPIDDDCWIIERSGSDSNIYASRRNCELYIYINNKETGIWTDEVLAQLLDGFVMPEYVAPELQSSEQIEAKLNSGNKTINKPEKKTR